MRKNIIALLLCFSILLSFYCVAYAKINDKKDEVSVLENVVLGDKELAKGIKIDFPSKYRENLFWNTEYTIGSDEKPKTDFTFNKKNVYRERIIEDYFNLYAMTLSTHDFDTEIPKEEKTGVQLAYEELVEQATPYVEATKRIRTRDYCEYYPLYCEFEIDNKIHYDYYITRFHEADANKEKVMEWISDFFKIPVIENEYFDISITVNENKEIFQRGSSTVFDKKGEDKYDNYNFSTCCTSDDENFYLSFSNRTEKRKIVDTSKIEGGYGIYCFKKPERNNETGEYTLYDIENVFPVDEENEVAILEMSEDKTQLYLITNEQDGLYMNVISTENFELQQKIKLFDKTGYIAYFLRTQDDFIIMEIGPDAYNDLTATYYTVISVDENGKHTQEMTVKLYEDAIGTYYYYDISDAAWDGERLYFVTAFKDSFNGEEVINDTYCGFSVSIYDKNGIGFFARYDLSLSTGKDKDDYASTYYVRPDDMENIVITLPKEK